ncbi:MAG: endonuclease [Bacteroidota bacterium]
MKRLFISISLLLLFLTTVFGQIPSGYYDAAAGLTGDNLRSALKTISKTGHVKLSYSAVWTAYSYTDVRPAPNNTIIWDMYSDVPGGTPAHTFTVITSQCGSSSNANTEGVCYSREHCLPNSWWGGIDDATHQQYTDLNQLFPADQYVNNYKSAHPIGQVGNASYTSSNGTKVGSCSYPGYTGVVFEPINEYKGDFARAYLYSATRYMDEIGNWVRSYPNTEMINIFDTTTNNFKPWFIAMLLSWHNSDTVSTKEINRNNAIYYNSGQHNRNPFVDHPEYVNAIWGSIKPQPSNYPTNFSAKNIHLKWADASGSVLPEHYLIRMSAIGYSAIPDPVNGTYYPNSATDLNVNYGVQEAWFENLNTNTTYFFKIFGYKGSGNACSYKIDNNVPQISYTTN